MAFTGSVEGGVAVSQAAGGRFMGLGLELGGKDPAYVRADADLAHAAPNLVEERFSTQVRAVVGSSGSAVHRSRF